jgi:hypothetical protein
MIYTVEEAAIKLNVAKQSIYTKLRLPEFKNNIIKKHGKSYVDDNLLIMIKDRLKVNNDYKDDGKVNDIENDDPVTAEIDDTLIVNNDLKEVAADKDYIEYLKKDITYLKDQLKENDFKVNDQLIAKDQQINNLNERLKQSLELNKNSQILQLRQPQDIKQLEEHFNDLDDKLEEVKNKMSDRKEQQEHKSFFSKIFKGND